MVNPFRRADGKRIVITLGVLGAVIVAAVYLSTGPANLIGLALGTGISAWRNRKQRARDSAFWSIVWQMRQSSVEDRARLLAALDPARLRDIMRVTGRGEVEPRRIRRVPIPLQWMAFGRPCSRNSRVCGAPVLSYSWA
jgi:hypothetical protein